MARTRTRLELRTDARQLADQVDTNFVTDAVANYWINQSVAELWDLLVSTDIDRYVKEATISTTEGTKSYSLPSDFYKPREVEKLVNSERITIEQFQFAEKNRYRDTPYFGLPYEDFLPRYRIMQQGIDGSDALIFFEPDPGTGTYYLWYVQAPQQLSDDADTFDGVAGWEDHIVYNVAIKMLIREESDPTPLVFERDRIERRIKTMSSGRSSGRPPRVQDTRRRYYRPV